MRRSAPWTACRIYHGSGQRVGYCTNCKCRDRFASAGEFGTSRRLTARFIARHPGWIAHCRRTFGNKVFSSFRTRIRIRCHRLEAAARLRERSAIAFFDFCCRTRRKATWPIRIMAAIKNMESWKMIAFRRRADFSLLGKSVRAHYPLARSAYGEQRMTHARFTRGRSRCGLVGFELDRRLMAMNS